MEDFVAIGKTQKPHGLKGELKLHVEEMFIEDLFDAEAVFIEIKGNKCLISSKNFKRVIQLF